MTKFPRFLPVALLLAACSPAGSDAIPVTAADRPATAPVGITEPVTRGSVVNASFWRGAADAGLYLIAAADIAGLEVYRRDGSRVASLDTIEAGLVVTVPGVPLDGVTDTLIVAYDTRAAVLRAFALDPGAPAFRAVMPEPLEVGDELTGLCHYRSRLSGANYLYAVTDAGLIHHYELYSVADGVAGRLLRTIPSGKGSSFCAVDPRDAALYVAEESNGVWRIGAEAEADTAREPIDLREPFGRLSDDIKGIAVYPADDGFSYLLVADVGKEEIAVYRLPDGEPVEQYTIEGLSEPEGLAIFKSDDSALLAIADGDQDDGGSDVKLVALEAFEPAPGAGRRQAESASTAPTIVRPAIETDVIPTWGDSADDPAIWVNPDDATRSLVIGTGKKSGLYVFDLDGRTLQVLEDGRMNNADVRDGFPLGDATVPIVAASNRSNGSIALYRIDAGTQKLVAVADGILATGFADPYGLCLYQSQKTKNFYVFVNEADSGLVRQWHLADNGAGRVMANAVRDISVGSRAEGCVADDRQAILYVAEEDVGLWKYSAEPDGGDARTAIDSTGESGRLTDDVEGIALYDTGDGKGYLVVSNQGANNYAVYRREEDNEFVGFFHIVANATDGIDGASETDGLDVSSAALGDRFPDGLLVVQDGRNIAPEERQNFKYVSWRELAAALEID